MGVVSGKDPPDIELLDRATAAYNSGDVRQALNILTDGVADLPLDNAAARARLHLQLAGWLRESGRPAEASEALSTAISLLDALPRSGQEYAWSWIRMEQGMAARET